MAEGNGGNGAERYEGFREAMKFNSPEEIVSALMEATRMALAEFQQAFNMNDLPPELVWDVIGLSQFIDNALFRMKLETSSIVKIEADSPEEAQAALRAALNKIADQIGLEPEADDE